MTTPKAKILKVLFPTFIGLLAVRFVFGLGNLLHTENTYSWTYVMFAFILYKDLFIILAFMALLIQSYVVVPYIEKIKNRGAVKSWSLWKTATTLSIAGGLIIFIPFLSRGAALMDLLWVFIVGTLILGIYWTSNLLTLQNIDSKMNSR